MSDVARAAGVSSMTVSNCFKYPEKVVEETRRNVLEAAAKLGYVPNLIAGNLASGRSKIVAAITPSIQNSNFAGMIMGLENELGAHGYHLMVSVVEAPEREYEAARALIGRRVDGIVLTGVDRTMRPASYWSNRAFLSSRHGICPARSSTWASAFRRRMRPAKRRRS
jgi:LacI family gluconate utilization system Gnt-I transcriptional repressor